MVDPQRREDLIRISLVRIARRHCHAVEPAGRDLDGP